MAQLKSNDLMIVPLNADGFRVPVSALRSLVGKDGVIFYNFSLPENSGEIPGKGYAGEHRQAVAGITEHPCSGSHATAFRPSRSEPRQRPPSLTPTSLCQWCEGLRYQK